jgi:hypothetical protein
MLFDSDRPGHPNNSVVSVITAVVMRLARFHSTLLLLIAPGCVAVPPQGRDQRHSKATRWSAETPKCELAKTRPP